MAAFSNTNGGYIIFGITNAPRTLVGLSTQNFDNQDDAIIAGFLNGLFSPEIHFERFVWTANDKKVGAIHIHESNAKPIVAIKTGDEIRESDIYYRYSARSERIKYPELKTMFDFVIETERKRWIDHLQKVSKIGVDNIALMDLKEGKIEGHGGTFLIDEKLLSELKFINEGFVSRSGAPTLKVLGEVKLISQSDLGRKAGSSGVSITDDPRAPLVRISEEDFRKQFPITYMDLMKKLRDRYSDFRADGNFQENRRKLMQLPGMSIVRYLDPENPKAAKKRFYSNKIISLFDRKYKEKKS